MVAGFEAPEDMRIEMEFSKVVVNEDTFGGKVADVFVWI